MRIKLDKKKIELLWFGLGFCLLFVAVVIFTNSSRGEIITQKFFDPIRTTKDRSEVVIVGVDDKSLQSLGAWPFNRSVFAKLNDKLNENEANTIIYDVLFLEKRDGDGEFLKSLKSSNSKIILASKINNNEYLESYFSKSSENVTSAQANVYPESDGEVRAIPNDTEINNACVYPMSRKAFSLFTHIDLPCDTLSKIFFRYPKNISNISLVDVLNGNFSNGFFKNKVVFIGSTSLDLEDHFVSLNGDKIPGVSVHASVFASLLNKDVDVLVKNITNNIIIFIIALIISYFGYTARSLLKQLSLFVVSCVLVVVAGYFSFESHYILAVPFFIITIFIFEGYTVLFRFIKEKKRGEYIQNIFAKYVSKDVLNELLLSEKPINLGGEKRYLSILFSDIRGFTSFSETMTPEDLTTLLNDYLSAMSPIILENRGTIDKYIGDAIMAFWNAPLDIEKHENLAVTSAVMMQESLKKFNDIHKTNLAMGLGVHAGYATVGNVGSAERINYTILGDNVNTTSRLESLTKKYGVSVIATDEIKDKTHNSDIKFRKLDVIVVKGKTVPLTIYEAYYKNNVDKNIVSNYERAFYLYQKLQFDEAKKILTTQTADTPSKNLIERIDEIESNQELKKTFDGVWYFTEK